MFAINFDGTLSVTLAYDVQLVPICCTVPCFSLSSTTSLLDLPAAASVFYSILVRFLVLDFDYAY
jgi:hypothetical protein